MLTKHPTLNETRAHFDWDIPDVYNIGVDICDKHAAKTPDQLAIIDVASDGAITECSFGMLRDLSNQLANVLSDTAKLGDRVAVLLPQCIETAAAHIAITKMGCISHRPETGSWASRSPKPLLLWSPAET